MNTWIGSFEYKYTIKNLFMLALMFVGLNIVNARCSILVDGYVVHIKSDIIHDDVTVHCRSKKDDLGTHVLHSPNLEFEWSFCDNLGGLSTLFYCHFWWKNFEQTFDVFNHKLSQWCYENKKEGNTCNSEIKDDGFYLYENHTTWQRLFTWNPKPEKLI
ncbi:putative plant self-incompatibility S1 [Helianthus anomalus]